MNYIKKSGGFNSGVRYSGIEAFSSLHSSPQRIFPGPATIPTAGPRPPERAVGVSNFSYGPILSPRPRTAERGRFIEISPFGWFRPNEANPARPTNFEGSARPPGVCASLSCSLVGPWVRLNVVFCAFQFQNFGFFCDRYKYRTPATDKTCAWYPEKNVTFYKVAGISNYSANYF